MGAGRRIGVAGVGNLDTPSLLLLLALWTSTTVDTAIGNALSLSARIWGAEVDFWFPVFLLVLFIIVTVLIF